MNVGAMTWERFFALIDQRIAQSGGGGGGATWGSITGTLSAQTDLQAALDGKGDVFGPSSATDNAVVRWDGTTGKLLQNSTFTISDGGSATATGANVMLALSNSTDSGSYFVGTRSANNSIILASNWNPDTGTIPNSGRASSYIEARSQSGAGTIIFSLSASNNTQPTERARINAMGNLLVNTASDNASGSKLQVSGAISATGGITTSSILSGNSVNLSKTITPAGTTGNRTINNATGSVNMAAGATSLVVTNSLVTANSVIQCTIGTNDNDMDSVAAVAAGGSFTIYAKPLPPAAETKIFFTIIN